MPYPIASVVGMYLANIRRKERVMNPNPPDPPTVKSETPADTAATKPQYESPTVTPIQAQAQEARVSPQAPTTGDVGRAPVPPSPEEAVPDVSAPKPSDSLLNRLDMELQGVVSHFAGDYAPETERALRKTAGDVVNALRHDAIGWLEAHAFPQEPSTAPTLSQSERS